MEWVLVVCVVSSDKNASVTQTVVYLLLSIYPLQKIYVSI